MADNHKQGQFILKYSNYTEEKKTKHDGLLYFAALLKEDGLQDDKEDGVLLY